MLDLEQVMILLQRSNNVLREMDRLTDELQDAVSREDHVSASLLLRLRAEEMEKYDGCREQILLLAETGPEEARLIQELVFSNPDSLAERRPGRPEEQKIYDIRRNTVRLISAIREKDRRLNSRVGGDRSFYAEAGK